MRDDELYRALLGLTPPWEVVSVDLDIPGQQVTVKVDAGPGPFSCPECQALVPGYDRKLRRWRHLDTCQFITWIEAEVPRVECPRHGVKQLPVPWAEAGSQFTALFERLAIDLLRECSVEGAAAILRISWDEAWGIKQRAVRRGLAGRTRRVVAHLGVDEKAFAKRHRYFTLVADLDAGCVLYVGDDRKQESLNRYWQSLAPEQRAGIEAIAMDMWEPYVQSTLEHVPEATEKIVFDKFHIAKHLHEAVDRVRRLEARLLRRAGDDRLVGTKYLWLMRPKDMRPDQRATFRALMAGAQGGTGVGAEGALPPGLGVRVPGGGPAVLRSLVLAGDPQPVEADGRDGLADPPPPAERPDLSAPSGHQCGVGGAERHHPVGEEDRPGVPERRELQDGDLLPLRRARPLPTRKPEEPRNDYR